MITDKDVELLGRFSDGGLSGKVSEWPQLIPLLRRLHKHFKNREVMMTEEMAKYGDQQEEKPVTVDALYKDLLKLAERVDLIENRLEWIVRQARMMP